MMNIIKLVLFYNFCFFLLISSFKKEVSEITSFFLRSPYNLKFGESSKLLEIEDAHYPDDKSKNFKSDTGKGEELKEHEELQNSGIEQGDLGEIHEILGTKELKEKSEENLEIEEYLEAEGDLEKIEKEKKEKEVGEVEKENVEVEIERKEKREVGEVEEEDATGGDYNAVDNAPSTFLIPGLGGSTLIVEYKNAYIPTCGKEPLNSKPFRLWLSLARLLSLKSNLYCTFDTIKLKYDKKKNRYYDHKGVNVTLEKQGYTKGVNYLDYFHGTGIGPTGYYNTISSYFMKNGYIDAHSIIGFPYDWRLPLYQQNYKLLKEHIEYIYEKRNKVKINLVGHSLGSLYINFFLSRIVNKRWKTKYLNSVTYINSPFKGSFKVIRTLLYGEGNNIAFNLIKVAKLSISDGMMKALGRSIGSLYDLIPYRQYYKYDQIVILINLGEKPIDINKMKELVNSCGLYDVECYTKRTDVKLKVYTISNWFELVDPELRVRIEKNSPYIDRKYSMDHGIPIHCVNSTTKEKETEQLLFYQSTDLNKEPYVYHGEGDGTVPLESLESCMDFYNAKETKWYNTNHCGILHDNEAVKYIYKIAHVNQS